MKNLLLMVVILLGFIAGLFAQAPDVLWTRTYGGPSIDVGYSAKQTSDGGFILTGSTYTTNGLDVWLIRTDSTGNALWTKTYGGIFSDEGKSVAQTSDGGFIITGRTGVPAANGIGDAFLIKTNESGDVIWFQTFGEAGDDEVGESVQQLSDGGYVITGSTYDTSNNESDILIIRTDSLGNTLWSKSYGGTNNDYAYCIKKVSPVGFIISGTTASYGAGGHDVWILRIDDSGNTIWTRTFGGNSTEIGYSVLQTNDGGFIVAGTTASYGSGSLDVWLIQLNNAGDTLWTKTYGGIEAEIGKSIQQTFNDEFVITGGTESIGNVHDVLIIKTDKFGDKLWEKTVGGSSFDDGFDIALTSDGGYVIAGITYSFGSGSSDMYLIRLDSDLPATNVDIEDSFRPAGFQLFQNYPNPFNPTTTLSFVIGQLSFVSLKVYDVLGNEVATLVDEYKPAGNYEINFNTSHHSSGIYFYQLKSGNYLETRKMILMR